MAGWTLFWFGVFLIMLVWNLVSPWSDEGWATYCHFIGIGFPVFFATVTGVWFTWGGLRDMRALFRRLSQEKINALDDGTVVGHQNLDELVVEKKVGQPPQTTS